MTLVDESKIRAAITGASGFVGKHLLELFVQEGNRVEPISIDSNSQASAESKVKRAYRCDISDEAQLAAVLGEAAPAQVYHLAAISSLGGAAEQERLAFDVNVWGTRNVFSTSAGLSSPPKVLFVSTSQVYSGDSQEQRDESAPTGPVSVYAVTKRMGELLTALYSDKLDIVTVRSFNHTGPGQGDSFVLPYLVKSVAEIEAGLAPPTLRVGNLDVERDFTDVRDVVRAYSLLMKHGKRDNVYNVCSGKWHRLSDLLEIVLGLAGAKIRVEKDYSRYRSNDTKRIWGNHGKLTEHTGWQPTIPVEQTLEDMLVYWRGRVVANSTVANRSN